MMEYKLLSDEINDLSFKFDVDVSIRSTELSIKSVKGE